MGEEGGFPEVGKRACLDVAIPKPRHYAVFNNRFHLLLPIIRRTHAAILRRSTSLPAQSATINAVHHPLAPAEISKLKRGTDSGVQIVSVPSHGTPPKPGVFVKETMNALADLRACMGTYPQRCCSESQPERKNRPSPSYVARRARLFQLFDRETVITVRKIERHTTDDIHRASRVGIARRINQQESGTVFGRIQLDSHGLITPAQPSQKARILREITLGGRRHFFARIKLTVGPVISAGHEIALYLLCILLSWKRDDEIADRIKDAEVLRFRRSAGFILWLLIAHHSFSLVAFRQVRLKKRNRMTNLTARMETKFPLNAVG
jgi:hypothetical protein